MKNRTVIAAKTVIHFKKHLTLKFNEQFIDSRLRGNDEVASFSVLNTDENYGFSGEKQ